MIRIVRAFLLLLALMVTAPAEAEPLDAKTPVRGWTIPSTASLKETRRCVCASQR
jgi:hypothetical protein